MDTFYLLCALLGGTVLVCQFAMTILGMGGGDFDGGSDGGIDVPHHGAGGQDMTHDVAVDASGHDASVGHEHHAHHGTEWFFKVISFQTLVAALAFFGIAGKAAGASNFGTTTTLALAIGAGIAAMYGVYFMLRSLHKFNADGTARIHRAVGRPATVYVPVPAEKSGSGKVFVNLQNREVEYLAMTTRERLPTGAKVVVTGILGPDTVEVEPAYEGETNGHA